MATQDDLGEWALDEGSNVVDIMLGSGDQTEISTFSDNKQTELTVDNLTYQYAAVESIPNDSYPLYDGYDSYDGHSEDSSSSSNSDSEDIEFKNQNGTDLNQIPIERNGMAVCEKCGTVGVKHAFYSKSKRFCSLACSRSYAKLLREGKPIPKPKPKFKLNPKVKATKPPKKYENRKKNTFDLSKSYCWIPYLNRLTTSAAAVSSFGHASLSDCWENITVGMKVEVENKDCDNLRNIFPKAYWIATVMRLAGYKALLRYEGFGTDKSKDFWVNLCTGSIHPVGWCATQGNPLIPPKTIKYKYSDWKEFLVKRLTGARTLPTNFHLKTQESLRSQFLKGMQLEVVDKNRISSMRVATVEETVGGRLHVSYVGADEDDEGFWCHEKSPLIHPVGWSQVVGHSIQATLDYAKKSLQKTLLKKYEECDTTWEMFPPVKTTQMNLKFKEGMKLEAIDPLNLSTICVGTVMKVLRNNYLMIGIDGYTTEKGSDWFCYHASSSCIFPVGFCEINGIVLTPPRGHKGEFKWFDYLKQTKSVAAPVALFNKEIPSHGFKSGMCLEAVDLMEPRLICVGTIARVVGRLLRVHFDGWDDSYDQWCDCESPDLYPVGWCEMVGYHLEPPRILSVDGVNDGSKKKIRKPKATVYKGSRKKKRPRIAPVPRAKVNGKTKLNTKNASENHGIFLPDKMATPRPMSTSSSSEDSDTNATEESSSEPAIFNKIETNKKNVVPPPPETRRDISVVLHPTGKTIPRLIDADLSSPSLSVITPELWNIFDVAQFLRVNDCGAYCDSFSKKRIDGRKFLTLSKEQIVNLTGMKVGPSLKIYDLIQQLKAKVQIS
uniref:FCS-type domain-containing protein n=1 Tax=Strigamia maritima TaxID=126957 RepID=T1IPJ4_STRMM